MGHIEQLAGATVGLSSRTSFRVPFGTGAAISRFLEAEETSLRVYDPRIFHHLRAWQEVLTRITSGHGADEDLPALVLQCAAHDQEVDADLLLGALEKSGTLVRAGEDIMAPAGTAHRQLMDGFDGLRTLQLVHSLRDAGLGNLPLRTALESARFIGLSAEENGAETRTLARRIEALEYATEEKSARSTPRKGDST